LSTPFFFHDTAAPATSPLSLHDALPIFGRAAQHARYQLVHPLRAERRQPLDADSRVRRDLVQGFRGLPGDAMPARHHRCDRKLRSEEHTSELQSLAYLVCRLLLEKKKNK